MSNEVSRRSECEEFNDFLREMEIEDIPLVDRKFTWFRPNGRTRSRIDQILVTREWLITWEGSIQYVLQRNIYDHCPILLKNSCVDWGPKPFRTFNCWLKDSRFTKFIEEIWRATSLE